MVYRTLPSCSPSQDGNNNGHVASWSPSQDGITQEANISLHYIRLSGRISCVGQLSNLRNHMLRACKRGVDLYAQPSVTCMPERTYDAAQERHFEHCPSQMRAEKSHTSGVLVRASLYELTPLPPAPTFDRDLHTERKPNTISQPPQTLG